MKILITGGTGFLGRHLVEQAIKRQHDVVFTGRNQHIAHDVLKRCHLNEKSFINWQANPNTGTTQINPVLLKAAENVDLIIHTAARSSPWGTAQEFELANVKATQEIIQLSKLCGISRIIHISSPSIYFDYCDQYNIQETMPLPKPVNLYAKTKRIAELCILESSIAHQLILRPRAIFGPWDQTLLPRLLKLMSKGKLPILRNGQAMIDLTYIDHLTEVILNNIQLESLKPMDNPIVNISNGQPINIYDLFLQLANAFQMPTYFKHRPYAVVEKIACLLENMSRLTGYWEPIFTRYSIGTIAFSHTLSIEKAKTYLNYQPNIPLAQAIQTTANWYLAQPSNVGML